MGPVVDPVRAVVISATPANVDTVMIDGRLLRQKSRFMASDAADLVRESEQSVRRIADRV